MLVTCHNNNYYKFFCVQGENVLFHNEFHYETFDFIDQMNNAVKMVGLRVHSLISNSRNTFRRGLAQGSFPPSTPYKLVVLRRMEAGSLDHPFT